MTPTTMKDLPRQASTPPTVTIYGPHDCPNCDKAMQLFDRRGVAYRKIDLEQGDENHVYVKQTLGYETAPVIIVELENGRKVHWGGHRQDMLTALVQLCTKGIVPESAGHEVAS